MEFSMVFQYMNVVYNNQTRAINISIIQVFILL